VSPEEWREAIRPWLREAHGPAFDAALEWLWPRCRTEEERLLAPALLLLLSPLNALVAPCRPVAGSCVNFQVTLSRPGTAGPERVRLTVRAGGQDQASRHSEADRIVRGDPEAPESAELALDLVLVAADPLGAAAHVLKELLRR